MPTRIALIADGRLVLADPEGSARRHESTFAEDVEAREQRAAEKNAWKQGDRGGEGIFGRPSVWGGAPSGPSPRPRIVSVACGHETDSIVYVLWTGVVGALLHYDFEEAYERRVFHREGFHAAEVHRHPRTGRLVCRYGDEQVSHLAVLNAEGRDLQPATEGDSIDGAPSWDPSSENVVVFHSAGVSRDPQGYVRGLGPFGLERLNLRTGEMETLLSEPGHDLLAPRLDARGNLYFIRRPYEGPGGRSAPIGETLKDAVLFPFRLIRAFVDFFNIFSSLVSKKPLTTAGGPKAEGPEPVRMWIHGRMIDAEKAAQNGGADGAFAPADWVLVKRSPDGEQTVIARRVLAYDVDRDGRILHSDGRNLHLLEVGGSSRKLLSEPLTDSVRWIESPGNGG